MASKPEESNDVIVIGTRLPKPSPVPFIAVGDSSGGSNNAIASFLDTLVRDQTTFNVDPAFDSSQKEVIVEALKRIANYPSFVTAFKQLTDKNAVVYVHPVTRSDQIAEDEGGTFGLVDGKVPQNGRIDVYVVTSRGEALSLAQLAPIIVHELIHTLGVPEFNTRLDARGSCWDHDVTNDLFRGYQFGSNADPGVGLADIIGGSDTGGTLIGSSGGSVFVGSDQADTFVPAQGGNVIYPRGGDNEIHIALGGDTDTVVLGSGNATIVLPNGISAGDVSVLSSSDGMDLSVLVARRPEVRLEGVSSTSAIVNVKVNGQVFPLSAFSSATTTLPDSADIHIDYFGEFGGGTVGSAAIADTLGAKLSYRLTETNGDYGEEYWAVDGNTGVITAQFSKPDLGGSQFTFLTVVAGDGATSTNVYVTVRWAYSNESSPEF